MARHREAKENILPKAIAAAFVQTPQTRPAGWPNPQACRGANSQRATHARHEAALFGMTPKRLAVTGLRV